MKAKKYIKQYLLIGLMGFFTFGCWDNIPIAGDLPLPDVAFTYEVIDVYDDGKPMYQLDYYAGAEVKFTSISGLEGECAWDFGDGKTATGKVVTHRYEDGGTYSVKLTVTDKSRTQPILIKDIVPIMKLNPIESEDGICEVLNTPISIDVELPNPNKLSEEYEWIFPKGTIGTGLITEDGVLKYKGENPGDLKFSHVGSASVRLRVKMGGKPLKEEGRINVPVAYNQPVPTLYYAVKGGNINALKLVANKPANMDINPFDMGISSGKRALNILYNDKSLYILDCGQQFTYVDDTDSIMGDGRINIMTMSLKEVEKVETMVSNVGGHAFNDPYYGYIEGDNIYFSNRNTGVFKLPLKERNRVFSLSQFPFYFQNATLGYYGIAISFGSGNACFTKINGVWHWCKTFNGTGIIRFTDADILSTPVYPPGSGTPPTSGVALGGMLPKSLVWDKKNQMIYFSVYNTGYEGLYGCTLAQFDAIGGVAANLTPYRLTTANGKSVVPVVESGKGEGVAPGEIIGICQLTLDEETGCVYFGYRSPDENNLKSGLMRYKPGPGGAKGVIEHVIEGVQVYGVAVNNTKSKLF